MFLTPGTRLGPYEITAQIGAGGMGEVYRAHDSRIRSGRGHQVKSSPRNLGEALRARGTGRRWFDDCHLVDQRSAPCTTLDPTTNRDGARRGRSKWAPNERARCRCRLCARLPPGRSLLPSTARRTRKASSIAISNPGTSKSGATASSKVLDFGLARIVHRPRGVGGDDHHESLALADDRNWGDESLGHNSRNRGLHGARAGAGKPVDKRADIWAFGVVLYEMLTGRRAFEGEDVSSILAAVIQSEPRWDGVPANVRRLLESVLKKIRRSGCAISATSGSYSMRSR